MVETVPSPALPNVGRFENSYARLPQEFFARLEPARVAAPRLIAFNAPLAEELGLDLNGSDQDVLAAIFSGNRLLDGMEPIAAAYAGHQFGNFVPQLGDGRAILLGEVRDRHGRLRDIQLKGSGPTPFSRRGDGRAALGPVLREYLISEAMYHLGVPTTRALAAVTTGDMILREGYEPGAVFTRVASSHVRVGSFQYFAARGDRDNLERLVDYAIDRHDPELKGRDDKALAFVRAVSARQAALIAQWMGFGFIHGVMNTDNMTISGETIDFGPCAFMDHYDPKTVFSSIDQFGRYAYSRQPAIAQWNIARLAEALLPLIDADEDKAIAAANEMLTDFAKLYHAAWDRVMAKKLGLLTMQEDDRDLALNFLGLLETAKADFTQSFLALAEAVEDDKALALQTLMPDPSALSTWLPAWRQRLGREAASLADIVTIMRSANPVYIPRNHRVEHALDAAVQEGDYAPFHRLRSLLERPFERQDGMADYETPPEPHERVVATFCGT